MSGEAPEANAQVSHEQDGRVLSGVGVSAERLAETMERHAKEPAPEPAKTTEGPPAGSTGGDGASPAAPAPDAKPTRGQQRFSELAKARDAEKARADAAEARAAAAEAKAAATPPAARETEPKATPAPVVKPSAALKPFMSEDDWFALPENEGKTWYDYSDARTAHSYAQLRDQERRDEAVKDAERKWQDVSRAYTDAENALRAEQPDYDAVLGKLGPTDVSAVVGRAAIELGPRVSYFLASHPEILGPLTAETLVHPDDPAFNAVVATTKRYLSTLVAAPKPAGPARPAPPPPPAPYQAVGGNSATASVSSGELAGKGSFDFDKSGYREKRAAERKSSSRR